MKPPRNFKYYTSKQRGFSLCLGCEKWKFGTNLFFHEGRTWSLCKIDYFDYWENTDELLSDYKEFL